MRRGENNIVKSVMEWKSLGKRPWGRPRKRWIDSVKDLKEMEIDTWREFVNDRTRLRNVLAAKTLSILAFSFFLIILYKFVIGQK